MDPHIFSPGLLFDIKPPFGRISQIVSQSLKLELWALSGGMISKSGFKRHINIRIVMCIWNFDIRAVDISSGVERS